ncbi:VOC family protein [Streptomyces sp. NPDC014894]|uniref:VOC family protein n=1 Tax=Streptomyces sp. NPDC014894 TaxID=3364931 RepID=UPI0036F945D0
MTEIWPEHLPVGAIRFARPTGRFDDVLAFYREDLGLPVIASWRDHDGYDGAVFGLPGAAAQMEITQHGSPPRVPEPDPENQLVLYLRGADARDTIAARLMERGHRPVEAANPYWTRYGAVLFQDPDGWMVVLAPWVFGQEPAPTPSPGRAGPPDRRP